MAFFWHQVVGGAEVWHNALSEHREKIQAEKKPAFVTVLDAHSVPDASWGKAEYAAMKYSGCFFADWDSTDIGSAIENFHEFLKNLEEHAVNLKCVRLYATGGKGFHLEIPPQVLMPKVPKAGVTALPYIYREMAMEMVVDTLDMRVYTGRRGRMWRTCGVQRDNGAYKVPLTLAEAWALTPESYAELCKAPRPEPERELPELSTYLSAMFVKFQEKVESSIKRQAKTSGDVELLAKFGGKLPPTIEKIMRGEGVKPDVGFQKLSMQLSIAANALEMKEDDFVKACEGLCKNHSSDSTRYGSTRKRKEELRRMWNYTHENPCYSYSKGGIRSLLASGEPSADLDGLAKESSAGTVEDVPEDAGEDEAPQDEDAQPSDQSLAEGVSIDRKGVHRSTQEGSRNISNIGWANPSMLCEGQADGSGHHAQLGLVVDLLSDGVRCGRHTVPDKAFMSRASLTNFCSAYYGIFSGSDTQSGVVKLLLSRKARKAKRIMYAIHKEGLEVIQNPTSPDHITKDVVWCTPDKVVTDSKTEYVFQPAMASSAIFDSDLHRAEIIEDTPETRAWLHAVLTINSPTTVAQMLGWFVSCFHKQFYQEAFSQFPLLHPNGPAGSGKTLTSKLFGRLFFMTKEPKVQSCGTVTTQFALKCSLTGSCSIPLILDEYKPSEMGAVRTDFLMQALRLAYNQGKGSSGAMGNSSASSSFRDIAEFTFSTPVAFIAEAQEVQTAIVQRSLAVAFSAADTVNHEAAWNLATAGQDHMSSLGRLILKYSFHETVASRKAALTPIRDQLRGAFPKSVHDRQVYNLAVVLEGLNFVGMCLRTVFGNEFEAPLATLKQAVYEHRAEINISAQSEAAKMFNDLTLVSRSEPADGDCAIREGYEYIVKEGYVEVLMRETFVKYFGWCRKKGMTPYYASSEGFIQAMGKFPPTMDRVCEGSPLKATGQSRVFRFNLEKLIAEGVDVFKTK